jgi:mannose-1-phosphate guanylyltransferase
MVAVSENHLRYAKEVLGDVLSENIVVEPQDDGTTFSVLYSVLRVREKDPNATVVFFPPDLRVPDAKSFMARVQDAIGAVQRKPKLILLGIEPASPDTDREWIEPDLSSPMDKDLEVWRVLGFRDIVSQADARELMKRGGLWNSSVMVGTISTFLRKIRRAKPEIYAAFKEAEPKIGSAGEAMAMRRIYYENYTESDVSRDVLQKNADQLGVIPVAAVKVKAVGRVSPLAARSMQRRAAFATIGGAAARA